MTMSPMREKLKNYFQIKANSILCEEASKKLSTKDKMDMIKAQVLTDPFMRVSAIDDKYSATQRVRPRTMTGLRKQSVQQQEGISRLKTIIESLQQQRGDGSKTHRYISRNTGSNS